MTGIVYFYQQDPSVISLVITQWKLSCSVHMAHCCSGAVCCLRSYCDYSNDSKH